MRNSSWTGRSARDLESAFGPYQRSSQCHIEAMPESFDKQDAMVIKVSVLCLAVLFVIFAAEWWFA